MKHIRQCHPEQEHSCLACGQVTCMRLNFGINLFENQFSGNIKQSRAEPAHRPTHRCWTGLSGLWEVCQITIHGKCCIALPHFIKIWFMPDLLLLAPSGALMFIMVYYMYKTSFSNLEQSRPHSVPIRFVPQESHSQAGLTRAILPIYTFIIHFHSVFNIKNKTRQYFCMNYIGNACMYKFLQDCTRFFRFL